MSRNKKDFPAQAKPTDSTVKDAVTAFEIEASIEALYGHIGDEPNRILKAILYELVAMRLKGK